MAAIRVQEAASHRLDEIDISGRKY